MVRRISKHATSHHCLRRLALVLLIAAGTGIVAAKQIPFRWTSEHRLPPAERFLELDAAPEDVVVALERWVADVGGEVASTTEDHPFTYRAGTDAAALHADLENLVEELWDGYDGWKVRKLKAKRSAELERLSSGQIVADPSVAPVYRLIVKVNQRTVSEKHKFVADSRTSYAGAWSRNTFTGQLQYSLTPVSIPDYDTRVVEVPFHSEMTFYVFAEGPQTIVYTVGVPVHGEARAGEGQRIDVRWWAQVDGKREADSVREAYEHLRRLGASSTGS